MEHIIWIYLDVSNMEYLEAIEYSADIGDDLYDNLDSITGYARESVHSIGLAKLFIYTEEDAYQVLEEILDYFKDLQIIDKIKRIDIYKEEEPLYDYNLEYHYPSKWMPFKMFFRYLRDVLKNRDKYVW